MSSTPASRRGEELRQQLLAATPGSTVQLEAQEYVGSFIITKPLNLIGCGGENEQTILNGRGGPALIVRSSGVRLNQLMLVDSSDLDHGYSLLVFPQAQPVVVGADVKIYGRMETMSSDLVINMGNILPQEEARTLFEVEVAAPSTVRCAPNSSKWLRVQPDTLAAAGKHMLQVVCDGKGLGLDGLAIGNLEITTGAESRMLWVTAQTMAAAPPKMLTGQISLALSKDQHVCFGDGFIIGKRNLPGVAAASSLPDHQALIRKEAIAWVLFQPWPTTTPTLLNDNPITLGGRAVLQNGDVIRVGGLDLTVEPVSNPIYSLSKLTVNMGTLGVTTPDPGLRVQCNNGGKEKLRLVSTIPWLEVSPAEIELRKGETRDIQVKLTADAYKLPPASYRERGAILLINKNETWSVDISLDVSLAAIIPDVSGTIDFGLVKDLSVAQAKVTVSNKGRKDWYPSIKNQPTWLIFSPSTLVVPAGTSTILLAKLGPMAENLPTPSKQTATALLEGDGKSISLPITLDLQLEGPKPLLTMSLAEFGTIDDVAQASPKTIIIRNEGRSEWQASAQTKLPWLEVQRDPITVPAGGSKSLMIRLNNSLPVGSYDQPDAIVISGMGKSLSVRLQVSLRPPSANLEILPKEVDFGSFDDWSNHERRLELRNRGAAEWSGTLRCSIPWLSIEPAVTTIKCAPRSSTTLLLRLNDLMPEGAQAVAAGLLLEGPGGPFPIRVLAHYQPAPKLKLAATTLDLGRIETWSSANPQHIVLSNEGQREGTLDVQVNVPWLEVKPAHVVVPAKGRNIIEVRLLPAVEQLAPGAIMVPKAAVLNGASLSQPLQVKFVLADYKLRADQSELTFSVADGSDLSAAVSQLTLYNESNRPYRGEVRLAVPWLRPNPARVEIPAGGSTSVALSLTENVWNMGTGSKLFGGAVAFEFSTLTLAVRLTRKPQEVQPTANNLEVDPTEINFGEVREDMPLASRRIRIRGDQDWRATLRTHDDWFAPLNTTVGGPAGQWVSSDLRLTSLALAQLPGAHSGELIVQLAGSSQEIAVKMRRVVPQAVLRFEPGVVMLNLNPLNKALPVENIRVLNESSVDADISLAPSDRHFRVSPASLRCPAGGNARFEVALTESAAALPDGRNMWSIAVAAGAQTYDPIPVVLEVARRSPPKITIGGPQFISFGDIDAASWDRAPAQSISIRNDGGSKVTLGVTVQRAAKWLVTVPELSIRPGATQLLEISLKPDAVGKLPLGRNDGTIELTGAGDPIRIPVALNYMQSRPTARTVTNEAPPPPLLGAQLQFPTEPLIFASLPRARWREIPPQHIQVTNLSKQRWEGLVEAHVDWLKVNPTSLKLGPGESAEIEIRLKPPNAMLTGSNSVPVYDEPDAVRIHNPQVSYSLYVCVGTPAEHTADTPATPPIVDPKESESKSQPGRASSAAVPRPPLEDSLTVAPLHIDFGAVDNWAEAGGQEITVSNRTDREITLTIKTVDWLKVAPGTTLTCPPRQSRTFEVLLRKRGLMRPQTGEQVAAQGVVIAYDGQEQAISVHVINP